MKTVAVTGISGYLGTGLLQRLERRDDVESIVGIDVKLPQVASPKLKFVTHDIREPFGRVFADNKVDSAIHLAFAVKPTHDYKCARAIDIDGAKNFIEACQQASVKRLLYLSSNTAYGPHSDNPDHLTEDMPLRPTPGFLYSWDKGEADQMFQDFMKDNADYCVTIVRACPVLGPRGGGSVSAGMYQKVMLRLQGYNPQLQYLHEDDLADILTMLIMQEQPGIFNAGGDGTLSYQEVIALTGRPCIVLPSWLITPMLSITWDLHLQSASPPGGLDFIKYPVVLNNEKLKKTTGYQFRYTTKDTLMSFLGAQKR